MALYVNEIFPGLETDEREGLLDVYAFMVGNDVFIEILKVRLSLSVARSKFISAMVEREMDLLPRDLRHSPSRRMMVRKKFAPKREFVEEDGVWTVRETGGAVGSWLYMVYDSHMSRMHLSPDSSPSLEVRETTGNGPKNTELLRVVTEWTSDYFGAPEKNLEFVRGPVPFNDYEIHTLSEYPIIYQMAGDLKMSIRVFDQMNVLLVDYWRTDGRGGPEPTEIFAKLVEQIDGFEGHEDVHLVGDFYGGQSFATERFVYEDNGRAVFALEPPFYIVNRAGKKPIGIANALLKNIIMDRSSEGVASAESRLRDTMRLAYYMGRDPGDLTYSLLSQNAHNIHSSPQRDAILESLGIEETDENRDAVGVVCFLDLLMSIYSSLGSDTIGNFFDKRYYTSVQAGEIRHQQIFDVLFDVVDQTEDVLLLRSPFDMPPEVPAMFGLPKVLDMYTLDPSTAALTENLEYTVDRRQNRRDWVGKPGSTPSRLTKSMGNDARGFVPEVDDRHREALQIHGLSSIPACRVPAQRMFDQRGVEFRDILVILLRYEENPGMLGGFVGRHRNRKPVDIFSHVKPFKPPFIMLNLLAPGMATLEERIQVILHEVSHFIDEILVLEGRADPSVLVAPQPISGDEARDARRQIAYWQQYLGKSPTEIEAHAQEVYYFLTMYEYGYALRNKAAIRRKIVKELLGEVFAGEPPAVTLERRKLYNDIFERAWTMYERDHLQDVESIPALEEGEEEQ